MEDLSEHLKFMKPLDIILYLSGENNRNFLLEGFRNLPKDKQKEFIEEVKNEFMYIQLRYNWFLQELDKK